jgi:timeless
MSSRQEQRRSPTSVASPRNNYSASSSSDLGVAKHVTPPPPAGAAAGAAPGNSTKPKKSGGGARINPEMVVDDRVLDELLLVCSVIGSTTVRTDPNTGAAREEFVPVTDCLNWLQDLQRALRRDHETYRPVSLKLGQWKVVSQKLLPLVIGCRYDAAMVLTVCKILVILTKPLSEAAKNAGRMTVDVRKGKVDER